MSCYTKNELEEILFSVVDDLDLSDAMIKEHGSIGTRPDVLVSLVLE